MNRPNIEAIIDEAVEKVHGVEKRANPAAAALRAQTKAIIQSAIDEAIGEKLREYRELAKTWKQCSFERSAGTIRHLQHQLTSAREKLAIAEQIIGQIT